MDELLAQVPDLSGWLIPIGAALAGVAVLVVLLRNRSRGIHVVGRTITIPMVLIWEAHGMYKLAVATGLTGIAAGVVAGMMAGILATLASQADLHHRQHGTLGWPGRLVWIVAAPMGLVVALSASTPSEFALRLALPLLAALLWWVRYAPVIHPGESRRKQGAWRWTPRRIGVALGLLDPTDADLTTVHAERQIRRLTSTAHRLHHGTRLLRGLRAARLRRLGLDATPEMVAEVHRRVALVHEIERLTDPTQQPVMSAPQADMSAPEAGHGPDIGADTEPDMERTSAGHDRADTTRRKADMSARSKRTSSGHRRTEKADKEEPVTADDLLELMAQRPDITQKQLAKLVGLSDRQVRRILKSQPTQQADMSASETGHDTGHDRLNGHAMSASMSG